VRVGHRSQTLRCPISPDRSSSPPAMQAGRP
jgi:hypothetical protein